MIYSKPTNNGLTPYSTVKLDGCSEAKLGFDFLSDQPSISKRRYCNKVLVHECVSVPGVEPLDAVKVEFMATSDPCYHFFDIFKTSEDDGITLQLDGPSTIGVIVNFTGEETCGLPPIMAYKLYVYLDEGRILVSNGNLCVTPCCCEDIEPSEWLGVSW